MRTANGCDVSCRLTIGLQAFNVELWARYVAVHVLFSGLLKSALKDTPL